MDVLHKLVENPAMALVLVGVALGVIVISRVFARSRPEPEVVPGLRALLAEGRFHDAAQLCLKHDRLTLAQEYFIRSNEPGRAALLAFRLSDFRVAGELYERAGDRERAAIAFDRAGLTQKARELAAAAMPVEAKRADPEPEPAANPKRQRAMTRPGPEGRSSVLAATSLAPRERPEPAAEAHPHAEPTSQRSASTSGPKPFDAVAVASTTGPKPLVVAPPRDPSRDPSKDPSRESTRAPKRETPRSTSRDVTREMLRETPSEMSSRVATMLMTPATKTSDTKETVSTTRGRVQTSVWEAAPGHREAPLAGLEASALSIDILHDREVRAAVDGASRDALRRIASGVRCDPSTLDVFYLAGLANLARGDWSAALESFNAVDGLAPGYRDARARADALRAWSNAMSARRSLCNGRYSMRGELARDGRSVAYRVTDTMLGRDVALRVFGEGAFDKREGRDAFLRDARAAAQLNHPSIVAMHDAGLLDGHAFVATEYVEGVTIEHALATQRRLDVPDALRAAAHVLEALDHAHGRSILHRDVRPSNIVKGQAGAVKLAGFGFASAAVANPYAAPEARAGRAVDARADLFSVGAVLYEMLSGERAPTGDRHVVPSLRERFAEVPAAIDEALRTVLDPDPSRRFASAKQFLAPIQRVLSVVDRAVEGRHARRSNPNPIAVAQARPRHQGPVARPKPTTAVMEEPQRQPAPRPKATLTMTAREEPIESAPFIAASESNPRLRSTLAMSGVDAFLEDPMHALAAPPPSAMGVAKTRPPTASRANESGPEPFKTRKGTLLMHPAPADAPPAPMSRPSPARAHADSGTSRWITRPNTSPDVPRRRPTSTMPPPA